MAENQQQTPKRDTAKEERLLRMLGSDNDHEALAALRKLQRRVGNWNVYVNELVKGYPGAQPAGFSQRYSYQNQRTWADAVTEQIRKQQQQEQQEQRKREQDAADWLADLLKGCSGRDRFSRQDYERTQSQMDRLKREEQERHQTNILNKIHNGEIKVEPQAGESRESFARRKYAVEALLKRFGRGA